MNEIMNVRESNKNSMRAQNFLFNFRTFQLCMAAKQDLRNSLAIINALICYHDDIPIGFIIRFFRVFLTTFLVMQFGHATP